jgi:hypothetical protein
MTVRRHPHRLTDGRGPPMSVPVGIRLLTTRLMQRLLANRTMARSKLWFLCYQQ